MQGMATKTQQDRQLRAERRQAGALYVHTAYDGDTVIGNRRSEHRYQFALVVVGQSRAYVNRWSMASRAGKNEVAVPVEQVER